MIKFSVRNAPELAAFLRDLPPAVKKEAVHAATQVILLDAKQYPNMNYVRRDAAYPETGDGFFTPKQRGWFWANLRAGTLQSPYQRKGDLALGWRAREAGANTTIYNDAPGAQHVMGINQSRHEKLVGWRTVAKVLEDASPAAMDAARAAVAQLLEGARSFTAGGYDEGGE